MRKIPFVILGLVLVALTGGFFWWNWATGAAAPKLSREAGSRSAGKIEEEIFVVKRGEGINSVAERLKDGGLIRSGLAFRALVVKDGLKKKIQAGDFRLNPGMTVLEIAQELTHGTLDNWVTIPEGWRVEEIAEEINSKFEIRNVRASPEDSSSKTSNSKFLAVAKEHEGRLFPDTYLIPKEATAEKIVDIFLKNFEKKFDQDLRQQAEKQNLTLDQVLTLASLVEREAREDKDRPIVAGILIKRWQNDWPLQADAAVQYIVATHNSQLTTHNSIAWWPKRLTKQDLKIDSPYNTYRNKGLPPGPICNPGLASIEAVLNFRQTDYWYYLSDSQGQMHYAKTNEEHVDNINKYLR